MINMMKMVVAPMAIPMAAPWLRRWCACETTDVGVGVPDREVGVGFSTPLLLSVRKAVSKIKI